LLILSYYIPNLLKLNLTILEFVYVPPPLIVDHHVTKVTDFLHTTLSS
jgi:hypothetical protein